MNIRDYRVLLDYTNYLKECHSKGSEISKQTIKEYLKEDYFHKKTV